MSPATVTVPFWSNKEGSVTIIILSGSVVRAESAGTGIIYITDCIIIGRVLVHKVVSPVATSQKPDSITPLSFNPDINNPVAFSRKPVVS